MWTAYDFSLVFADTTSKSIRIRQSPAKEVTIELVGVVSCLACDMIVLESDGELDTCKASRSATKISTTAAAPKATSTRTIKDYATTWQASAESAHKAAIFCKLLRMCAEMFTVSVTILRLEGGRSSF